MNYQDEDPARTGDFDFCNALSMSLFGRPHDESEEAYENRVAMRHKAADLDEYPPMSDYEIQEAKQAAEKEQRMIDNALSGYKKLWG